MYTLFVDVDDTLITWCPEGCQHTMHPFGAGANHWRLNEEVYDFMCWWSGPIVIWSGGGDAWAEEMATKALPPEMLARVDRYESKWTRIPSVGDLFIDDDPFESFAGKTLHPNKLKDLKW